MKKTLLLSAALFTFGAASAQVSIIPKAGFTLATQQFREKPDPNERDIMTNRGFTAGLGFNVPVGKSNLFSIQPELAYVQKGYRSAFHQGFIGTVISNNTLNYLEMPLLGQVRFGTERIKVFATAGPSLAYCLNGRYTFRSSNAKFSDSSVKVRFGNTPVDASPDVFYLDPQYHNRLDVGIQAGLGIGLAVGPGVLQLEARYGHGLTAFFKGNTDNDFSPDDDPDLWNRAAAFTLGYAIPLGGR
jgi:hypothetical protein